MREHVDAGTSPRRREHVDHSSTDEAATVSVGPLRSLAAEHKAQGKRPSRHVSSLRMRGAPLAISKADGENQAESTAFISLTFTSRSRSSIPKRRSDPRATRRSLRYPPKSRKNVSLASYCSSTFRRAR